MPVAIAPLLTSPSIRPETLADLGHSLGDALRFTQVERYEGRGCTRCFQAADRCPAPLFVDLRHDDRRLRPRAGLREGAAKAPPGASDDDDLAGKIRQWSFRGDGRRLRRLEVRAGALLQRTPQLGHADVVLIQHFRLGLLHLLDHDPVLLQHIPVPLFQPALCT